MRLPSSLRYLACFWLVLSASVVDGEMTDDNESPSHRAKTNDNDVGTHYWLVEDYPNPESDEQVCNTGSKRLCDPDSILSTQQISQVSEALALTRRSPTICRKEDSDAAIEIQLAVALAKNVDLSVYSPYEDEISKAAEVFARKFTMIGALEWKHLVEGQASYYSCRFMIVQYSFRVEKHGRNHDRFQARSHHKAHETTLA